MSAFDPLRTLVAAHRNVPDHLNRDGRPMSKDIKEIGGACHCGAVQFRVELTNGLHSACRCTCSYCRMRGAVAVSASLKGLTIVLERGGNAKLR